MQPTNNIWENFTICFTSKILYTQLIHLEEANIFNEVTKYELITNHFEKIF